MSIDTPTTPADETPAIGLQNSETRQGNSLDTPSSSHNVVSRPTSSIYGITAAIIVAISGVVGVSVKLNNDEQNARIESLSEALQKTEAEVERLRAEQKVRGNVEVMMKEGLERIAQQRELVLQLQSQVIGEKEVYDAVRLIIDHLGDFMIDNHGKVSETDIAEKFNQLSVVYSDFASLNRAKEITEESVIKVVQEHANANAALEQSLVTLKDAPDDFVARKAVENALERVILSSTSSFGVVRSLALKNTLSEEFVQRVMVNCEEGHTTTMKLFADILDAEQMKQILVHRFNGTLERRMAFLLSASQKNTVESNKE